MGERFSFTVERDRWQRGEPMNAQLLCADDGKMCCLGFFLRACGLEEEAIRGLTEPQQPFEYLFDQVRDADIVPAPAAFLVDVEDDGSGHDDDPEFSFSCSAAAGSLMHDNDRADIDDATREELLRIELARHNVDVTFVDGPAVRLASADGVKS